MTRDWEILCFDHETGRWERTGEVFDTVDLALDYAHHEVGVPWAIAPVAYAPPIQPEKPCSTS